jgi:hypothetical protein
MNNTKLFFLIKWTLILDLRNLLQIYFIHGSVEKFMLRTFLN